MHKHNDRQTNERTRLNLYSTFRVKAGGQHEKTRILKNRHELMSNKQIYNKKTNLKKVKNKIIKKCTNV